MSVCGYMDLLNGMLSNVNIFYIFEMQFRHLANKIGNLERPFLKEFIPRWVESCGCPLLR